MSITYSSNYMHGKKLSTSADLRKSTLNLFLDFPFVFLLQLYLLFYTHSNLTRGCIISIFFESYLFDRIWISLWYSLFLELVISVHSLEWYSWRIFKLHILDIFSKCKSRGSDFGKFLAIYIIWLNLRNSGMWHPNWT